MSSTQPRYPVSLRVAFSSTDDFRSDKVTNISAGGMFLSTNRKLPVGELVSVALELPDGDRPAPVQAKVIHVAARSQSGASASQRGVGVQFIGSDDTFRARVDRYIQSILREINLPVRLLLIARDLLHENGWAQSTERGPGGSYCLGGALSHAAGDDDNAYRAALQSVGPRLNAPECSIGGFGCHCVLLKWNDAAGRTKREVIAKLDEVINAAFGTGASA